MALMVTLGVMLLRLPVGWGIQQLLPNPQGDPALYYATLILQEMLLWGLPALLMLPFRSRRLVVQRKWLGVSTAAVFIGAMTQMAMMAVTPLWVDVTGAAQGEIMLPRNEIQWVLAVLALVVVPALVEEAFFRGGLLTGMCDTMGALPALLLSTLVFALMHGSLAGFPAHLAISRLCGLGMLTRGRLRVPVVMHMCYNGAALLLRNTPASWMPALPLGVILTAAAMWMCAQILWRGRYRTLKAADTAMLCVIVLGAAAMYIPELI